MSRIDYYKKEIEKQAGISSLASGLVRKALPTVKNFTSSSLGKRVAVGSIAGGALKGMTYDPSKDGNSKARAIARGVVTGGVLGGVASSKNIANAGSTIANKGKALSDTAKGLINSGQDGVLNQAKINVGNFANEYGQKMNNVFGK